MHEGALLQGVYSSSLGGDNTMRATSRGEARTESATEGSAGCGLPTGAGDRRLEMEQAETVGIQKKVAALLGIPLKSPDDEEND